MEAPTVREASERIDELLDDLGHSAPPAIMERVQELLHCVLTLHAAGLERVLETVPDGVVRTLADDELVGKLLVLHDLHPDDVDTRVQAALDKVRPYLGSHAGGVHLSGVDADGVVHLRLEGSCDGCPSSAMTVKNAIEDAILQAAPDVVAVEAEGMVEERGPKLLQIPRFAPHGGDPGDAEPSSSTGWEHVELDVPPRTTSRVEVAGERMVVANLDGTLVAYLDRCPSCFAALSEGVLDGDTLTCSSCRHTYDVRLAGRSAEGGSSLSPLPLLPEHGGWKVSLPRSVVA